MGRRIVALILLATAMAVAVAASLRPLNVKTGLWQMTATTTWTGLPPQLEAAMANGRTNSYQSCVKTEDLSTNPWAEGSGEKCAWTVLSSTGTDMEVRGTSCNIGSEYGMTAEVHGEIHVLDSENGTGSFEVTMTGNGQTVNGHTSYTGKWVGSSCPAE
jgi:hypothetical protein